MAERKRPTQSTHREFSYRRVVVWKRDLHDLLTEISRLGYYSEIEDSTHRYQSLEDFMEEAPKNIEEFQINLRPMNSDKIEFVAGCVKFNKYIVNASVLGVSSIADNLCETLEFFLESWSKSLPKPLDKPWKIVLIASISFALASILLRVWIESTGFFRDHPNVWYLSIWTVMFILYYKHADLLFRCKYQIRHNDGEDSFWIRYRDKIVPNTINWFMAFLTSVLLLFIAKYYVDK